MPCAGPSDSECRALECEANRRRYRIEAANEGLNRQVACAALQALEDAGVYQKVLLPKFVRRWWADHKRDDDIRREARVAEKKRGAARKTGLAKLTTSERKALGLKE